MKTYSVIAVLSALVAAQERPALLTRTEALRLGREGNLALQEAGLQRDAADAARAAAGGALLPGVSLASTLSRTGPNLAGDPRNAGAVSAQPDLQWSSSLQFSWTFLNPGALGAWRSAAASADAAGIHARGQAIQLSAALDLGYHDVVRQQLLLAAAAEELELSRVRRDIAISHRTIGISSALEPLQAQLAVDADSAALLVQLSSLDQSRRSLNALIGRDPGTPFRVEDSIPLPDPGDREQILSEARAGSPGLAEAESRSRAATATARAAEISVLSPTVSAFATYGLLDRWHDRNPPSDLSAQGFAYGLQATWSLFAGGSQSAQARSARAQSRIAELVRADSALQLERGVSQGWDAWIRSRAAVELGDRGMALADSVLRIASAQYRSGGLSGVDLRQAQENAMLARSRAAQARWTARVAGIQLIVAAGREPK
jgi:outer membrane protein TolC